MMKTTILGAIAGDVIGSPYERYEMKSMDFELYHPEACFTDDTVLTIAVAKAIMDFSGYRDTILEFGRRYPHAGYGGTFIQWLSVEDPQAYNSWGNGSAMRVSPVGFAFNEMERVLVEAGKSAMISHDHPEGIKGARAIAACVLMARQQKTKAEIRAFVETTFEYDLDFTIDGIRDDYQFDVSCQGSVPQAIVAFLESEDYEHAIRLAISLGGDSDTIACMAGGIAGAYYDHIPAKILDFVRSKLPIEFLLIIDRFDTYCQRP